MIPAMVRFVGITARACHVPFFCARGRGRRAVSEAVLAVGTAAMVLVGCTPTDVFTPRTSSDVVGAAVPHFQRQRRPPLAVAERVQRQIVSQAIEPKQGRSDFVASYEAQASLSPLKISRR